MNNLKRKKLITLIVFIMVIVIVSLLAINIYKNSHNTANNVKLNNAGYLENWLGESKLFLVSANVSYGVCDGQDCFIITATIRNDYTAEQPPPVDGWGGVVTGRVYFGVGAILYDVEGSKISANNITPGRSPHMGVQQTSLESGETGMVDIYMATNSRNVDNYSVDLAIFAAYPIP